MLHSADWCEVRGCLRPPPGGRGTDVVLMVEVRAYLRPCRGARVWLCCADRLEVVTELVKLGAVALAALNAVPGVLGAWRWYRCENSRGFWVLLRVGAGRRARVRRLGRCARGGRALLDRRALLSIRAAPARGRLRGRAAARASAQTILDQRDLADAQAVGELPEHEQQEVVAAIVRREMGVMTLSCLVVVFLALRAAETAHGL